MDDPQGFRAQQEAKRIYTGRLRSGRVEEEYLVGFRDRCRVFLEVDPKERKVVGWRYGMTEEADLNCYLSPNVSGSRPK